MRQTVDESNFSTVKTLLDAGLKVSKICEITQISSPVIYRVKHSNSYAEFDAERKRRYVEAQMIRDGKLNQGSEIKVTQTKTESVPTTAQDLVQAVTRVAIALEKNNEKLEDIYEKLGDSNISLQELVSAWKTNN